MSLLRGALDFASPVRSAVAPGGGGASPWRAAAAIPSIDLAANHAVDPYLVWARLTDFAGFLVRRRGHEPQIPVLMERSEGAIDGDERLIRLVQGAFTSNPLNVSGSLFGTAHVPLPMLGDLCDAVRAGVLARFQLGLARGEQERVARQVLAHPIDREAPSTRALQTVGIIDDGCCLAHEACRPGGKPRFVGVWDQDPHARPDENGYWKEARSDIPYGVELSKSSIESVLAERGVGERAERSIYAALGRPEWGTPNRTHGAGVIHVLTAVDARMIFVQLPRDTVADTSGGSLGVYVLDGARYIVDKTKQLAAEERCPEWRTTINISLGSIAGPHDGTTITECALAELASRGEVKIVLAAGNTAGKRIHGMRRVSRASPGRFDVMAPPDNPREAYVELWLPATLPSGAPLDPARIGIEVIAPGGTRSRKVGVGQAMTFSKQGKVRAGVVFARRVAQGRHGTMVLLAVRSTRVANGAKGATAPYGIWSIIVSTEQDEPIPIHAWVERNDLIVGRRRPQQAHFIDDPDEPYVSDAFTLSSIANGDNVTVVGSYRLDDETIASYSANGPTRSGGRMRPDFLGPSDQSAAVAGMPVPGFFSGWTTRMSGTSVATPHVVRWLVQGEPAEKRFEIPVAATRRSAAPRTGREAGPTPDAGPRTFPAIRP